MSGVRKFKVRTKLATVALKGGGITAANALKMAEEGLDPLREEPLNILDACLAEIDSRFGRTVKARATEPFEDLYDLSSRLIDASMGLPGSGVDHAARALCGLADLSLDKNIRDWEAIDVHIETLRLLRSAGQSFTEAQRQSVLDGLKKVTLKRVGDPNAEPGAR